MLTLTLGQGKSFKIGDTIEIHVVFCKGGRVRLGIDAPKSLDITRPDMKKGKA